MIIVEQGNRNAKKWWVYKDIVCNICGTVVQLEPEDTVKEEHSQREGTWIRFPCPTCHELILFERGVSQWAGR